MQFFFQYYLNFLFCNDNEKKIVLIRVISLFKVTLCLNKKTITGFFGPNEKIKTSNHNKRYEGRPPVYQKHDSDTQKSSNKTDPHIIKLKTWSESRGVRECCVKTGIVDESVGHQEEIGNNRCYQIQFACNQRYNHAFFFKYNCLEEYKYVLNFLNSN